MRDLGKVRISEDGKVIINPYPDAMTNQGQKILVCDKDGELHAFSFDDEDSIDSLIDPKIDMAIPTKSRPAIGVKRVVAHGNGQHIIIDRTMMEAGELDIGDIVYVYILKVEGERDG